VLRLDVLSAGSGGYRFNDFLKLGVPLDLVTMAVTLSVIPPVSPLVPA